jgi:putative membrane protein
VLKYFTRRRRPNVLRGLATGITAGIAATIIMDQFHKISTAGQRAAEKQRRLASHESAETIDSDQQHTEQNAQQPEDSTEIVARKIAEAAGKELAPAEKKTAGQAVHYAFGTLMGAVYGVAAELLPEVTTGGGTAYGSLLFLAADEVAVPAFQLSPQPSDTAPRDRLQHWAAHVVYGGSLELVRSLIRRLM